jgi:tellurite resistance protein
MREETGLEVSMKLGKNVFLALAAVGMADGVASDAELEGLAHAARESGIDGAELDEIKAAARTAKGNFGGVKKLSLSPEERLYAYAIATWLVRIDGMVMPEEKMALAKLGDALLLADGDRTRASAASFRVWQLDPTVRPQRFDLAALAEGIRRALAESQRPPPEG